VRGGEDVTGITLIRFYAMHVLYLPFLMFLILWAHLHIVKRQGVKGGL
jgi:quinol-cytochrome oxidoreductase complex cytochrome b subunit